MIVPLPSVVVVVVVVSETWPHANGAANAKAMLNTVFFMFFPLLVELPQSSSPSFRLDLRLKELLHPIRIRFVLRMFAQGVFS